MTASERRSSFLTRFEFIRFLSRLDILHGEFRKSAGGCLRRCLRRAGALRREREFFWKALRGFPFNHFFHQCFRLASARISADTSGGDFFFSEPMPLFLIVGFLSAYTTFSAFEQETYSIGREDRILHAAAYVSASLVFGFAGLLAGVWLARRF